MLILIFKVIDHHLYIFKTTITSMQQIQGKLPKGRASSKAYRIKENYFLPKLEELH